MDKFLSCDWGTSTFRLRLIDVNGTQVIAEERNDRGIADTYARWKQQGGNAAARQDFYLAIIKEAINRLAAKVGYPLHAIPVVLSGMVSSTIGLMDIPYKELPLNLDGSDLSVKRLDTREHDGRMIIISGARTTDDVMRGEETKVVGCASVLAAAAQERLLVLPGTHPKHVVVRDNQALTVRTFMTGEFFDLLSTKSVLSTSVEGGGDFNDLENQSFFSEGVRASQASDLLHSVFKVRTNDVLNHIPKQQNFYYLSGLLIGAELAGLDPGIPVYIVGNMPQVTRYKKACHDLGIPVSGEMDADLALIRGQYAIFSRYCLE